MTEQKRSGAANNQTSQSPKRETWSSRRSCCSSCASSSRRPLWELSADSQNPRQAWEMRSDCWADIWSFTGCPVRLLTSFCWHENKSSITVQGELRLGFVDLDFECFTVCLTLLGLMGFWQKQLGKMGEHSQPNLARSKSTWEARWTTYKKTQLSIWCQQNSSNQPDGSPCTEYNQFLFTRIENDNKYPLHLQKTQTGVDWKSLTIPASFPITTDYFPAEAATFHREYTVRLLNCLTLIHSRLLAGLASQNNRNIFL